MWPCIRLISAFGKHSRVIVIIHFNDARNVVSTFIFPLRLIYPKYFWIRKSGGGKDNGATSDITFSLKAALSAMCNPPQPGDESHETFLKVKHFFVVCFFSLFLFVLLLFFAFSILTPLTSHLFCFVFYLILLIVVLSNKTTTVSKNWRWFEPFSDIPLWNLFFRVNEGLRGFSSVTDLSWAEVMFQGEIFTTFIDLVGFRIPLKDDATRPFGLP